MIRVGIPVESAIGLRSGWGANPRKEGGGAYMVMTDHTRVQHTLTQQHYCSTQNTAPDGIAHLDFAHQRPVRHLADAHGLVVGPRRHQLAIGAERHAIDIATVSLSRTVSGSQTNTVRRITRHMVALLG